MRWRDLAAGVVLVLSLGGCASTEATNEDSNSEWPTGDSGTPITEMTLRNGVLCAVMDDAGHDLNCDWNGPRGERRSTDPKSDAGTMITVVVLSDGTERAVMDGDVEAIECGWDVPR
jgi:hypothetical protein